MKRVLSWTGGVLLTLVALGATAHASTSVAAHERGECIVCNLHDCLYSMLFQ
jgi:hypothetical protein